MIEYFTFDLEEGRQAGLVRRIRDDDAQTDTIEVVSGGQWVDDPSALRFFEPFGGDQLELMPLTEEEARARAAELGVTLADELVTNDELRTLSDDELVALIVKRSNLDAEAAREALAIIRGGPPEGVTFDRG